MEKTKNPDLSSSQFDLIIIGGGAAGFFAAAESGRLKPGTKVLILEKTGKVLGKVKISGGGRCNVTHNCLDPEKILGFYPRGNPWLTEIFKQFSVKDSIQWFEKEGVKLKVEADGRMFPTTNDSQTIVDALTKAAYRNPGFSLHLNEAVTGIRPLENGYEIATNQGSYFSQNVLLSAGGQPGAGGISWLSALNLKIVPPVPSLFTFNTRPHPWAALQGISLPDVRVSLLESDFHFRGPLLVTHWGFSGPAILKLSAFAARYLAEKQYRYRFSIDFYPDFTEKEITNKLNELVQTEPTKKPLTQPQFGLPKNLWIQLCQESGLDRFHNWAESGKKGRLDMAKLLHGRTFQAEGKTTYKDEFVTAGGIDLEEVDSKTAMLKRWRGIFVAGELLNVDGITGGFNFQAAWSTAAVAAKGILS